MDGKVGGHGSWGGRVPVFCSACLAEMEQGVAGLSITWFKKKVWIKKKSLKSREFPTVRVLLPIVRVLRCLISSFIKLPLEVDVTCTVFVQGVRSASGVFLQALLPYIPSYQCVESDTL